MILSSVKDNGFERDLWNQNSMGRIRLQEKTITNDQDMI
jgi:hypothetical protein